MWPQMHNILSRIAFCSYAFISICALASCSKEETVSQQRFSVSVSKVEDFSATVIVTHTGTNRDVYYAIAVKGDVEDVYSEISEHHNDRGTQGDSATPYNQKKRIVKLNGLLPDTEYTCIVYGVDDFGDIKGVPAKASFRTESCSIVFEATDIWAIGYRGQDKYNGKTYSKIDVTVQGDVEERFFVRVLNKQVVEKLADPRSVILYAYNDFISEKNETEDENFWIDDKFVFTGSIHYFRYLNQGTYQVYVIGVDANGRLTGHYAYSEEFVFDKYELEADYAYLIGDWEVYDGLGGYFFFTLSEKWANSTLTMSGWGNNDCPLTMNYDPSGAYFLLIPGQTSYNTMTLRPWYLNEENKFIIYYDSIVLTLACTKGKNDDGSFTFSRGFNVNLASGGYASTNGMVLTYYDEKNHLIYYKSSKIQFPFTMSKKK